LQLKLVDIDTVELLDKRGYLTICMSLLKEGKIYLRRPEGIRDWYNALQVIRCQYHQHFTCSFYACRSQKCKRYLGFDWIITLSWSVRVRAVHRTLMKLSPSVNFINILLPAFTLVDHKSVKKWQLNCYFYVFGVCTNKSCM